MVDRLCVCHLVSLKMAAVIGQKQQQQSANTSDKGSLLRRGSQAKKPLKEKIVQIYEAFFRVRFVVHVIYSGTYMSV